MANMPTRLLGSSSLNASSLLSAIKWIAAAVISVWAKLSITIHVLVGLMALDFFTGLTGALVLKRLSADVSFRGLVKKVMILTLVYVGHMISVPLNVGFDLGEMVALAYILNEVLSIIENCVDVGVPIPPILVQTLGKFWKVQNEAARREGATTTLVHTETVVIPPASKVMDVSGKEQTKL